ncbi:endo-1,4-beta-glucanase [Richelia intracellularis]|nr:endo-1,4-beta-glucanase [Richelia intracellularis]
MSINRPSFAITRSNPGTEVATETAAALAAACILFREQGEVEYANTLLTNAEELYDFANTYGGKYSDSIPNAASFYNSWSGYQDELAWGASWLYDATGDAAFLQKAESTYQSGNLNRGWTMNLDDKSHGVAVKLAQQGSNSSYQQDVENWLNAWTDGHSGVQITNRGLRWIS